MKPLHSLLLLWFVSHSEWQRHIQDSGKHLGWSFFAKIVNGINYFRKTFQHRCFAWLQMRL